MSSEQRASSAVRNLRSIFENKTDANSPDSRGRSPSALSSDKENGGRQTSKVRASFVPVGPVVNMSAAAEQSLNALSGATRRGSFGEADANHDLKQTVSQEQERRVVPDGAIESAAGTPLRKPVDGPAIGQDNVLLGQKGDAPPANPDKPVTAAEEEPTEMKSADPTSEAAVSGGEALLPVTEDLRASTRATAASAGKKSDAKKPTTNGKPAAISTKPSSKPAPSALKSPASQPKTPQSATKAPVKKASRSSLTAPTAASMAHSRAVAEKSSNTKTSPTSATKKREVTKPISLPSHLTAPTASSRAKHEAAPAPSSSTNPLKASTASRPTQSTPSRPTPRSSLAAGHRPPSQTSQPSAPRRSVAPADGSFLERMMKPTAASAGKSHEKAPEVKSSPKAKAPAPKPKVNGNATKAATHAKPAAVTAVANPEPEAEAAAEARGDGAAAVEAAPEATAPEPTAAAETALEDPTYAEAVKEDGPGNETPVQHVGDDEIANAALEATPAGIVSEETIR